MFERYTERARRVIFFARYEASQLGSNSIETEHLLLGLIREGKGLTSRIFSRATCPWRTIRKEIEGPRPLPRQGLDLASTSRFRREQARPRVRGRGSGAHAPQLHRHRAHPARPHARGEERRRRHPRREGDAAERGPRRHRPAPEREADVGKAKETPLLAEFSRDLTEAACARSSIRWSAARTSWSASCRCSAGAPATTRCSSASPASARRPSSRASRNKIVQGDVPHLPRRQADPRPRHLADRGRHEVPRPVRGAPQDDHAGAHREPQHHHLHRRAAHAGGGRARPKAPSTPPTS